MIQTISATDTLVTQVVIHTNMSMIQMVSDTNTLVTQVLIHTNIPMIQMVSDTDILHLPRTVYCERKWSYIRIL